MLMSTTAALDGKPISRYLGIVTGEAIIGANVFRDMFAAVRDIVGGRSATYESPRRGARRGPGGDAEARRGDGANAIIGIDRDTSAGSGEWHADGLLQRHCRRGRCLKTRPQSVGTQELGAGDRVLGSEDLR